MQTKSLVQAIGGERGGGGGIYGIMTRLLSFTTWDVEQKIGGFRNCLYCPIEIRMDLRMTEEFNDIRRNETLQISTPADCLYQSSSRTSLSTASATGS